MGQFALGLRSLLIKAAIFVVMAALLAWALGGTLWPRPEIAEINGVTFGGQRWYWQLAVGGKNTGEVRWRLMIEEGDSRDKPFDDRAWDDAAGLMVADDALYFAAASSSDSPAWRIERIAANHQTAVYPMPDRLAVEQQLERLRAGLPLQEYDTIVNQRQTVLDPP